ncbi:hypothetical protein N5J77_17270 [Sphingobium yanoikuyae]|jgi:hypothetical protein|uniref:EexN family lipoprotein n=1 Tax=Sphingobium yanoikuyae TaxID=13690 RepID=A0AA43BDI5_SPHYA|nr:MULTISPECIES: hypothetical protein [Sphingomonadaceae]MDH2132882.1 hypothetical protein [Sphingobium yanoikuyae]MDH2149238.1 hypothetical protein [Sphingobium yanoikuyae]MDH2168415.1 hypothetical protein [Sphingobium yanoikuyae]
MTSIINKSISAMINSNQRALIAAAAAAATIFLTGCGLIKPRDAGYFRFHAEEARLVVTRCERGQKTGSDCQAAAQAVAELDAAAPRQAPAKGGRWVEHDRQQ